MSVEQYSLSADGSLSESPRSLTVQNINLKTLQIQKWKPKSPNGKATTQSKVGCGSGRAPDEEAWEDTRGSREESLEEPDLKY